MSKHTSNMRNTSEQEDDSQSVLDEEKKGTKKQWTKGKHQSIHSFKEDTPGMEGCV